MVWRAWSRSGIWPGPVSMPLACEGSIRGTCRSAARRSWVMKNWWTRFARFSPRRCSPAKGTVRSGVRLRHKGVRTCKDRVLRLLRNNQLLSPARQPDPLRTNPHEGTIVTELPSQMWGTDATATFTEAEGTVTIFAAIDYCTAECIGIHAVKKATRFEALEPIRQGVNEYFGGFSGGSAAGLRLRHDHGSVYMGDDFQAEIRFLGIETSPAFVRQPEGKA